MPTLIRLRRLPSHDAADATSRCISAPSSGSRRMVRSRSRSVMPRRRSIHGRRTSRCRRRRWSPACGCRRTPALVCASHDGTLRTSTRRRILATAGSTTLARQHADLPLTSDRRERPMRPEARPTPDELQRQAQRHAGDECDRMVGPSMRRTVARPSAAQHITATIDELVVEPHAHRVDGCGSPPT